MSGAVYDVPPPRTADITWLWKVLLIMALLTPALVAATRAMPGNTAEPYTELFFSRPGDLPAVLRAGEPVDVSFRIVNHAPESRNYDYQVTAQAQGQEAETVASDAVHVPAGSAVEKSVAVSAQHPDRQYLLTVKLGDPPQFIHFRTES